tara:strand:+ start:5961 stop:7406 length:1446 start_codon:yes stop_codon:yes gene_type:complete
MSEMALADEELVQRLNALPIDQRNAIMQNVLNPNQQTLQLPYPYTPATNLREGIGNFFNNMTLGTRQALGMAPTIKGQLANQTYIKNFIDLQESAKEIKRGENLREWYKANTAIKPELIENAPLDQLESIYSNLVGGIEYIPGAGVGQVNLSTNQAAILGQSTGDMKEYEVVVAQIDERNKNLPIEQKEPIPSFTDYIEQKKVIERTPPAALQIYDKMLELNPEIAKQTPEQKTELLNKIMRQGRDPDYIFAEQLAALKGRLGGVELTPGQIELDKKFATTVESYENAGGYANSQRNYKELNGLIAGLLAEPRDGSSSISGRVVYFTPLPGRSAKAIDTKDQIDRIITQDLRQTLGAQFTQQEGERFVAYAYNIMLPPHINARRLARMRNAMEQASKAKRDSISYFKKNGTLKGFKGTENVAEGIYESIFREEDYADFDDKELAEMFARVVDDPNTFDEEFEVIADLLIKRNIDLGAYNVK